MTKVGFTEAQAFLLHQLGICCELGWRCYSDTATINAEDAKQVVKMLRVVPPGHRVAEAIGRKMQDIILEQKPGTANARPPQAEPGSPEANKNEN